MVKVSNPTVCFFDSGIGGLCLLYECVRRLPDVDFIYFSDNDNVPYGSLPQDKLIKITDAVFSKIAGLNPAAAVIACNTVTARCIDYVRSKYCFQIVGIQPAVKQAANTEGECIVLSTPSTADSQPLKELIDRYGKEKTRSFSCKDLAQYIENNYGNIDESYVESLLPHTVCSSVVLGCTHYVYIKETVKKFYNCPVFDGISGTADHLVQILGKDDHSRPRAQKITFIDGNPTKNKKIFANLIKQKGLK